MSTESVLVHCCCAHCAAYTLTHWRQQYSIGALWYNPNIHPFTEHEHRVAAMKSVAEALGVSLSIAPGYEMEEYFRRVAGNESDRCRHCFDLRLGKAAAVARDRGFAAFTTTLLISPHQKHDLIRESGERASLQYGVAFLYADLRKRYSDSRHITKPMDVYRQQYCGCLYSERERYASHP